MLHVNRQIHVKKPNFYLICLLWCVLMRKKTQLLLYYCNVRIQVTNTAYWKAEQKYVHFYVRTAWNCQSVRVFNNQLVLMMIPDGYRALTNTHHQAVCCYSEPQPDLWKMLHSKDPVCYLCKPNVWYEPMWVGGGWAQLRTRALIDTKPWVRWMWITLLHLSTSSRLHTNCFSDCATHWNLNWNLKWLKIFDSSIIDLLSDSRNVKLMTFLQQR